MEKSARWLPAAALLAVGALTKPCGALAAPVDCRALVGAHAEGVVVETAKPEPAGPLVVSGPGEPPRSVEGPAVCKATGVVGAYTSADGAAYGVRFELRLPDSWNGRFLFQGGGGLDGSVQPAIGPAGDGPPALARGYAVLSMDGGHEGLDARFASNQQARLDFAYQAVGKATAAAKTLILAYYRQPIRHSFFVGCSNGGREAMMAAQRYPLEFDGVVAGAPGFRLSHAAVQEAFANMTLASIAPRDAQGRPDLSRALSEADMKLVSEGVLKACDAEDGLVDGLISHPEACRFTPMSLACRPGQASGCLAPQKAAALDAIFAGAKDSTGRSLYSRFYWDSGVSQAGWRQWMLGAVNGSPPLNVVLGGDSLPNYFMSPPEPALSPYRIDLDKAQAEIAQTAAINDATSTFLNSFTGHGGKLILYHGVSDPVFSAADTAAWYEALAHDDPASARDVRLFLVPAMNHCGGGRTTDRFDMLSALEAWVETGRAPGSVTAQGGAALAGVSRPLCAYPSYARYQGGAPEAAASFKCVSP